jgi:hypothetical protein
LLSLKLHPHLGVQFEITCTPFRETENVQELSCLLQAFRKCLYLQYALLQFFQEMPILSMLCYNFFRKCLYLQYALLQFFQFTSYIIKIHAPRSAANFQTSQDLN